MMAAKGMVRPVYEVMKEAELPFEANAYLPALPATIPPLTAE
jgi:hypothetical protein